MRERHDDNPYERDPLVEQYEHEFDLEVDSVIPLMLWLFLAVAIVIVVGLLLIFTNADWSAVMDYIAPTAKQSRDLGAHNIVEMVNG